MDTDSSVEASLFWAMTVLTCIERVLLEEDFSPWHCRVSDRPSTLIKQGDAALTFADPEDKYRQGTVNSGQ
jgi:hypothetical protein